MKMIVDIDEETYNDIKKGKIYSSFRDVPLESTNAIANGTPLDDIRAEIEELDGKYVIGDYATYGEHSPKYVQLMEVLQIIDRYKAERSDKG